MRTERVRRVGLIGLAALALSAPGAFAQSRVSHVTMTVLAPERRVPASFLGVSVEDNELPRFERPLQAFAHLLRVLKPPGERAPVTMRVGGESADSSFWGTNPWEFVAPPYRQSRPYELSTAWMQALGALLRSAGAKVILDLNLAAHSPQMAAQVAGAARTDLPGGSVSAFEIGNEPDLYAHALVGFTQAEHGGPNQWAFGFKSSDYISLFGKYVRAVSRAFPGARFAGPSTISRSKSWVRRLISSRAGRHLSLVTAHSYPPFEGCASPGDPQYPAPARYLRDSVSAGVAHSARYLVALAHHAGLPLDLTEVGSSTCGGIAGQTDTFATALWVSDFLFNSIATGTDGVSIHLRGNGFLNSALNYTPSGIYAEPLFYGMALFSRTLGSGARLMRVGSHGKASGLKTWVVRLRDRTLHLLYINKSARDASVTLRSASTAPARLERLSAPSIEANSTVTLAGQRLGSDGLWHGSLVAGTVPARHRSYRVSVPAFSAALLSVPPR